MEKYGNTELTQLANVYNANLELYGLPGFYPGQRLFINPFAMGLSVPTDISSPAFQLGIGGYHIVIAVRSSIKRGEYTTNVECRWESSDGQLQLFDGNTNRVIATDDFVELCQKELAKTTAALNAVTDAGLTGPQFGIAVEDSTGSAAVAIPSQVQASSGAPVAGTGSGRVQ